jgi:hypothetical protein
MAVLYAAILLLAVTLSPFLVYLFVKVAVYAALKAKADFKKKEESHGTSQQEEGPHGPQ